MCVRGAIKTAHVGESFTRRLYTDPGYLGLWKKRTGEERREREDRSFHASKLAETSRRRTAPQRGAHVSSFLLIIRGNGLKDGCFTSLITPTPNGGKKAEYSRPNRAVPFVLFFSAAQLGRFPVMFSVGYYSLKAQFHFRNSWVNCKADKLSKISVK